MTPELTPDTDQAELCKAKSPKRMPLPSGRTLQDIVTNFKRPDGDLGLRVREMTHAMHVAAETLKVSLSQPERLSLASIFGLAELMGIKPEQLVADLFHQVSVRKEVGLMKGRRQTRVRQNRGANPAANSAAKSSGDGQKSKRP